MINENIKQKILMFSGGKDSTALLIGLIERKIKIKVVFADAGLEFKETYDFLNKVEKKLNIEIIRVKHPFKTFENLFYKKRPEGKRKGEIYGFPFVINKGCWINKHLKLNPAGKVKKKGDIVYLGINADEKNRIQLGKNKKEKGILTYPLIDWGWGNEKCIEVCKKKGLLNPLYKRFHRNGCWLCPKQPRRSLQMLFKYYPHLWEKLKQLEKDSPHGFKPNFSLEEYEKKIRDLNNKRIRRFI